MAQKGRNPYGAKFKNPQAMGGNHQAQTVKGILQEGQKSYKATVDAKLGTNHVGNKYAKQFSPIQQDLGKQQPAKAPTPSKGKGMGQG